MITPENRAELLAQMQAIQDYCQTAAAEFTAFGEPSASGGYSLKVNGQWVAQTLVALIVQQNTLSGAVIDLLREDG